MRRFLSHVLIAFLAFASFTVHAVEFPERPPDTDFYVDQAAMINPQDASKINTTASKLLQERRIPLFVVTIESLDLYDAGHMGIEGYATALFDHWGIGLDDYNYGILLLVSRDDRKARIELGAGYGHDFDPASQRIMDKLIIPHFKSDKYSLGISDGVRGLDSMARGERIPARTQPVWLLPAMIGVGILLVLIIWNLFRSGRSGWAWALIAAIAVLLFFLIRMSANTGSSGGFGGGSSGGGGATGSW